MFNQCIFCHRPLGTNESVERFPVGQRVAFDPQRGRLWAVCSSCQRWNLAPIEDRWEALEDLELKELEAHWREEEELAAIIDGELTELPALEKLRLKLR